MPPWENAVGISRHGVINSEEVIKPLFQMNVFGKNRYL